jgi:hypothetical protein
MDAVANDYARIALEQGRGIANPDAYVRKARQTALEHPDIGRYLEHWPTAPASAVAGWLHGDKHSMSYYPEATALAPVTQLHSEPA